MSRVAFVRCAALVLAIAPAVMPPATMAQSIQGKGVADRATGALPVLPSAQENAEPVQRSSWLEKRIAVQHTITSNVRSNATQTSGQITEVAPGLRWIGNTARIKGFADYSLHGFYYVHAEGASHIQHHLNARAAIEAIEQRLFVDVTGVVTMQPISVFGAPVDGSPANPNAAQTSSFGISPYLRGRIGNKAEYEARYSVQDTRTDTVRRSDVRTQEARLRVDNRQSRQLLGWSVEASQEEVDFSLGRTIDTATLRTRLSYAATPQWMLLAMAGVESTNQLSLDRESSRITGVGVHWRPSERTRVTLEQENRYFGKAHNVLLEHRTAHTVWRYSDTKGVSQGLGAQSASLGGLFDLLYGFYAQVEPDPILRSQRTQAEIDRLGLSPDLLVPQDFLRSASTLQRVQELSLALLGQRSMAVLAMMQTDNRRLGLVALSSGDDLDANTHIRQRGWSLLLAHRLTPQTAVQASLVEQRSVGTAPGQETRVRSAALGMSTQLAPRTSLGLQVRRSVSDGRASAYRSYNESALMAILTHRF